jgi:hypothetical protein
MTSHPPLLKRISTLAFKAETTPGTKNLPGASDGAVNAYDIDVQAEITVQEREVQGSFNRLKGSPGARKATVSFKTDLGWDGLAHPQWASVLFPACGVVASGDVYKPVSAPPSVSGVTTITMSFYLDGMLKVAYGCMGNFKIVGTAGAMGMIEWEFQGLWDDVSDATIIDPSYPQDLPARFAEQRCTYDSIDQVVESVEFDCGNEVIMREDGSTDPGFKTALVVDRYPKINANPEATLVADQDTFGDWLAAEEAVFTYGFTGPSGTTTPGTIIIAAPKAQILNCQAADRNKLAINDIEFGCNKNGQNEDEEFSITFTDKT